MRKFLSVLIGFVILAAAGITLWMARGPLPSEERTTGGVLIAQSEITGQIAPNLEVVTDEGTTSTNIIGEAEIKDAALSDIQELNQAEMEAAPPTIADVAPPGDAAPLTTDIVLDKDVEVEVAPLDTTTGSQGHSEPGEGGGPLITGLYEQRVVEMEWPSAFRVGGSGSVRITLKALEDGSLQAVAEIADNEVLATPIMIADRYDTYNAIVTAYLSAPDFEVEAANNLAQTLERGGEAEWRWTLKADEAETVVIAIGLSITWQPKDPNAAGTLTNVPIWGQMVQVNVDHVFGLITVPQASIAGTVLAVLGFVAEFPLLGAILETIWDMLFGKKDRDQQR
ncbi:MAG: hypothetical protein JXJ20_00580 [Anaerolineae bacterium]|nr:hypothetical protein [Anaerolineae bacterium]